MLTQTLRTRSTEEEFLALAESHDRIELIDGEVILSPAPTPLHQYIVLRLAEQLLGWVRANPPAAVGLSPLDVRLDRGRVVQPDVFVVASGFDPVASGPLDVVPDLVVEVLSHNRSYDRIAKKLLYAEAGVSEYWIVDPEETLIELVQGLNTVATINAGAVQSVVLSGLAIELTSLFPAG